jgi:hypothetical protein
MGGCGGQGEFFNGFTCEMEFIILKKQLKTTILKIAILASILQYFAIFNNQVWGRQTGKNI